MEIAHQAGLNIKEAVITRFDLYTADECFLTGTAAEVIPVVEIDNRLVGNGKPGKVTRELIDLFKNSIKLIN
jgi:branched-chain amino acid aminotransferase